jgi:hypothetical protein
VRHFHESKLSITFDLHVLSTPPAFVLSQDQTLQFYITETFYSVHSLLTYFLVKSSVCLLFSFQRPAFYSCPPFRAEGEDNKSSSQCQSFYCSLSLFRSTAASLSLSREGRDRCGLYGRSRVTVKSFFQTKCPLRREPKGHFSKNFGGDLLSHIASHAVSSAR